MAFAVEDFQDLIRLLGERPEWRAELRREILTGERISPIAEGLAQASGVFQALDGHIAATEGQIDS